MTALDAERLADKVRNEYLTKKRDTDPVADALDVLHKILVWAETPPLHDGDWMTPIDANTFRLAKRRVRLIAGQE